jgi:hypothetical protein
MTRTAKVAVLFVCIFIFAIVLTLAIEAYPYKNANGQSDDNTPVPVAQSGSGQGPGERMDAGPPPATQPQTLMESCSRIADEATSRMQLDAVAQRTHLLARLQSFHGTLKPDSTRRKDLQQLMKRIDDTPTPGLGTEVDMSDSKAASPTARAAHSISTYDRHSSAAPAWRVALQSFNDKAASLGVHARPAVQLGPRLAAVGGERCEDLAVSDCDAHHCAVLRSDHGGDRPILCVSRGRSAACWIVPPTRADAWSQCDGPTEAAAGVAFDDEHYAGHPVGGSADCAGRLAWWTAKCRWRKGEAKSVTYTAVVKSAEGPRGADPTSEHPPQPQPHSLPPTAATKKPATLVP